MKTTVELGTPDYDGMARHAREIAYHARGVVDGFYVLADTISDINKMEQRISESLSEPPTESPSQSLTESIGQLVTASKEELTRKINADVQSVKNEIKYVKNEITSKIDALMINIAAREFNSIARQYNHKSFKLRALHSVHTNTRIMPFPTTVDELNNLTYGQVGWILEELDDPFHRPSFGTEAQTRTRLAMFIGVQPQQHMGEGEEQCTGEEGSVDL
ncbi:hypothetical protein F4680DRAFT_442295 [Xylaria scruposa]|nr:hypothetical protein F4680DRAFT_442295 [Xylaria scruposa]